MKPKNTAKPTKPLKVTRKRQSLKINLELPPWMFEEIASEAKRLNEPMDVVVRQLVDFALKERVDSQRQQQSHLEMIANLATIARQMGMALLKAEERSGGPK